MRNLFALVIASVVLLSFTEASAQTPTPGADLNGDGTVDGGDLLLLLGQWHVGERYTPTPTETPFTPTPSVTNTPTEEPAEITVDLPGLPAGAKPLVMVRIPSGSFQMGSNDDSSWSGCYPCEQPVHEVTVGYDFYMAKHEVTQAQWLAVMGSWPGNTPSSTYGVGDNYPAYYISWNDCQNFIAALNALGQGTFRLPSEAEWEYACRAGSTTRFSFGNSTCSPTACSSCDLDAYAWWCGNNSPNGSKPVGGKLSNAWDLYDMHGNVWEWCQDYWHDSYSGDVPTDGSAWEAGGGTHRVTRGGSWNDVAWFCRSPSRYIGDPDHAFNYSGFRVARTP